MYKLLWEVFKKTGSIEAYLYLYDYRILNKQKFTKAWQNICNSKRCEKD